MIHIFIGTKAQYVKTAPVLRQLDEEGIAYNLIDSGQHAQLSKALRVELGVREPDLCLRHGADITTVSGAVCWMAQTFALVLFRPRVVRERVFRNEGGICLVHGDTPTTLLSVILARRVGLEVAHIEAGLRSFSYIHPFPEELIRVIVMRLSHVLFCGSDWACRNLAQMRVRGTVVNLDANTIVDALSFSLRQQSDPNAVPGDYCLATVHRVETLHHRARLRHVVHTVMHIASSHPVVFVVHQPTEKRLRSTGLYSRLETHPRIRLLPLVSHADFIHLLQGADFVLTDGGSIQEECACLGKPCLLMRKKTERRDGLDANVRLSGFDDQRIADFVEHWRDFIFPPREADVSPSKKIVDYVRKYA